MMMVLLRASVLLLPLLNTASGFVALPTVGGLQQRRCSANAAVRDCVQWPHVAHDNRPATCDAYDVLWYS